MTRAKHKKEVSPPANGRALLSSFAEQLRLLIDTERRQRALKPFPPSISDDAADYVLTSLEAFEREPDKGLDRAFGLVRRGRPVGSGEMLSTVHLIADKRLAGDSWEKIMVDLDRYDANGKGDVRTIQRMVSETYRQEYLDYVCGKGFDKARAERSIKLGAKIDGD